MLKSEFIEQTDTMKGAAMAATGANMSLLGSIGSAIGSAAGAISKATSFVPALAPITAVTGIISKIAPSAGTPVKVPTPVVPTAAGPTTYTAPVYTPPPPAPMSLPFTSYSPPAQANVGVGDILRGAAAGAAGAIAGGIGGAVGGAITNFFPGMSPGTGVAKTGCGCGSAGRDPCTHQRLGTRNNPAPLATFWGGCCPPGRVLRRKPYGRDICIKQPKMNVFNPRALARADMRITGFVRRAAPILHDMGFKVERTRHAHGVKIKGRRRARR